MKQEKSFTLIEILVVIVVIGILSSFILVGMSSITNSANIAKGKAFANSLRNSLLMNLVSEWKLDDATGNATIDYWKNNNGTLGDGTCSSGIGTCPTLISSFSNQCALGGCYSFDGTDDYINFGSDSSLKNNTITYSVWVYPRSWVSGTLTSPHWIYWTNDGVGFVTDQSGGKGFFSNWIQCGGSRRGVNTLYEYDKEKWYNVVMSYDGVDLKLYVNGLLKDNQTYSCTPIVYGGSLFIGRTSSLNYVFNGNIDDFNVYSAAMPASTIKNNYFAGLNNLFLKNLSDKIEYKDNLSKLRSDLVYEK